MKNLMQRMEYIKARFNISDSYVRIISIASAIIILGLLFLYIIMLHAKLNANNKIIKEAGYVEKQIDLITKNLSLSLGSDNNIKKDYSVDSITQELISRQVKVNKVQIQDKIIILNLSGDINNFITWLQASKFIIEEITVNRISTEGKKINIFDINVMLKKGN